MSHAIGPWPVLPLKQLASEMCLGKMLDKDKNRGELKPYLRNVNVRWFEFDVENLKQMRFEESERERFALMPGDLVVCEGGEPGRAAIWNGQMADARIQKALHRIRFDPSHYLPRLAMYFLFYGTITDRFARDYTGTTIKHLTGKALSKIEFPLPPLAEQRRIVDKLDELLSDLAAAVLALEGLRAKLKQYRAAVLKAAVEGTLSVEWRRAHPDVECAPVLLKRILAERRGRWEEARLKKYKEAGIVPPKTWNVKYKEPETPELSSLPTLPDGWCWATLEQLTTELSNGFGKRSQEKGTPHIVLRLADILDGEVSYANPRLVNATPDDVERYALSASDLLIIRVNGSADLVGRVTLVREADEIKLYCDHFIRAKTVHPRLSKWIRAYGDVHDFRRFIDQRKVSSAGQNTISQTALGACPIPLPPSAEQDSLLELVEDQFSVIDHLESDLDTKLKSTVALRLSILRAAFEGKLVPQDLNDEPASELLKRIAAERAERQRLAKEAKKAANSAKARKQRRGCKSKLVTSGEAHGLFHDR